MKRLCRWVGEESGPRSLLTGLHRSSLPLTLAVTLQASFSTPHKGTEELRAEGMSHIPPAGPGLEIRLSAQLHCPEQKGDGDRDPLTVSPVSPTRLCESSFQGLCPATGTQ